MDYNCKIPKVYNTIYRVIKFFKVLQEKTSRKQVGLFQLLQVVTECNRANILWTTVQNYCYRRMKLTHYIKLCSVKAVLVIDKITRAVELTR